MRSSHSRFLLMLLLCAARTWAARAGYATGYMYSYYVPPAASTPWRPAWSPDGKELAFSLAGSIWKIRVGDTAAYELTASRTYDSSPAWSPDGRWIAYTAEGEHGIGLMLLNVATGESAPLAGSADLNLDPTWSPDGRRLAFVRGEPKGQFHIYVMAIENGRPGAAAHLTEPHSFGRERLYFSVNDDHIQPSWSPDGQEMLLVSNRGIALGSGAIWRARVEADMMRSARMILREETLYRAQPQWSPDGRRILYSSHRGSQYDNLYVLPVKGGEPYQLTHGDWDHFDARWSPDGEWIAYISNQRGLSDLRLLRVVGGEERAVEIRRRVYRRPMGKLAVEANAPARWYLVASDGKSYAPADALQRAPMQTAGNDYFHAAGRFVVDVPEGELKLTAVRGIEYPPVEKTVAIRPGEITRVAIELRRKVHMNALGWYSGTDHTHMNYGGNLHNTPENMMFLGAAEDLNVLADKICNKDNRVFDWQYFTGAPSPLSTPERILRFDEEYRPPFYGHINLINLTRNLISPFTTGYEQTAIESLYPSNTDIFRVAREQGAIGGYVHPWSQDPPSAGYAGARGFPVDLALGAFDYLEVLTWSSSFTNTAKVWHRALNCGFKVTAAAGEDSILGLHASRLLGSSRMYVYLGPSLTWERWVAGIRRGRTFVTNGPLLGFEVNGELPGSEIHLPTGGGAVDVTGRLDSIVPVDRLELFLNGAEIRGFPLTDRGKRAAFHERIPLTGSGWLTLRAISNGPHFPIDDQYVVAETSPVYVYCGNQPIRSREDAEYFIRWIDDITRQAESHPGWRSDRERRHVLDQFAEARRIFMERAR
jgi:TolB protein